MTIQEFDKLYVGDNVAVHCPTEELANEFLKLADSFGYKTWDGGRVCIVEDNNWHIYKKNTVYYVKFGRHGFVYGHVESAKLNNEQIVEYKLQPQKSLLEQVLELIGLEVEQEFIIASCMTIYKFDKCGKVKMYNPIFNKWNDSYLTLTDMLLNNYDIIIESKKPKSEADIALEELNKAIKKATDVLKGSGYNVQNL